MSRFVNYSFEIKFKKKWGVPFRLICQLIRKKKHKE